MAYLLVVSSHAYLWQLYSEEGGRAHGISDYFFHQTSMTSGNWLSISQTELRKGGSINSGLGLEFILIDTFNWGRGGGSCHNKGGKDALYWLDFVWQSWKKGDTIEIRRGSSAEFKFYTNCGSLKPVERFCYLRRDSRRVYNLCLPPIWGIEQAFRMPIKKTWWSPC